VPREQITEQREPRPFLSFPLTQWSKVSEAAGFISSTLSRRPNPKEG